MSPFQREPIFHDRQTVLVAGPITTVSSTFEDITGATLTTKDLSVTAFYQLWVSMELEHSNNNSTVVIRAALDGSPLGMGRSIHFGPSSAGNPQSPTLVGSVAGVTEGQVLKLEWNTNVGTAQINDLVFMIDGIPDSRVVT